ncbi:CD109 antigen-like [Babylonia areolata]|uniref:CD109 antigen-like n=1 Tax=Babylonia areolata TaxID=304850 RepID=UPI003FD1448E
MAGRLIALQVLAACLVGGHAYSEAGKYLVTAPEQALPGAPYTLTVQVLQAASPVNVSAYLEGDDGYSSVLHKQTYRTVTPVASVPVSPGSTAMLMIQVPENIHSLSHNSRYRLHVRGSTGLQFEETYSVSVAVSVASVFIQTDKAAYTPGDTVTFKTFAFYKKDLTPYTGVYNITLKGGNTVLGTWSTAGGQALNTFTFDLDTHTVLGTWTLTAFSTLTGVTHQTFTVGPKKEELSIHPGSGGAYSGRVTVENTAMEVKVHLPKTMNSSTDLTGSFEATYPMGVGVKGTADILLSSGSTVSLTIPFNGSATFTFPYSALKVADTIVSVRVTDEETGMEGMGEAKVKVYERDVKIQFTEQTPAVYKPRLPFTAYIKITNNADEPLHVPSDSPYSAVYVYGVGHYFRQMAGQAGYRSSSYSGTYPILARRLTLPDSGALSLDLDIPEDVTSIDLVVTFQGVQKKLTLQQAQHSESDSYLQIYLMDSVPAVSRAKNADVRFRVLSSQPFSDLTVEAVSRGRIISAVQPTLANIFTSGDAHSAEFSLTLTWDMTPVTEVIAYHLVERDATIREVVSDSMAIRVDSLLDDTVSVTSDAQRVTPGQEVTLSLQARAGAHVGVLVEESNGASGQVVTPGSVTSKLLQTGVMPLKGAVATSSTHGTGSFALPHLLLMNGGVLSRAQPTTPVKETAYSEQGSTEKPNTVYLGTNTTGSDGRATFTVTLPESVTTWSVTGFAFDDAGHVAVVDQPLQIDAVYEVYGELLGPDHVVSGEQVVLTAFVHNARNSDSQVTLTLKAKANVQTLQLSNNATFRATAGDQLQTVTVPAKNSKQVFFMVTSPVGTPIYTSTAEVELLVTSGASKQTVPFSYTVATVPFSYTVAVCRYTVPFSYTVAPRGVEKTFTFSDLTHVDGHLNKDITVAHPYPKTAMPGTVATRLTMQEKFSDLMLPLALAEKDVMEEGTELAALLHFALPVLMAKFRPEEGPQLKGPIGRGYQRLVTFWRGSSSGRYPGSTSVRDWVDMTVMQAMAMAKPLTYVADSLVTGVLFKYFQTYGSNSTVIPPNRLPSAASKVMTIKALEAYYSIAIQDLHNNVNVRGHGHQGQTDNYDQIMFRVHNLLREASASPSPPWAVSDPLTLSYLALACVRYGFSADGLMAHLLKNASSSDADVLFWNTDPNDNFNYFGDWLPGRHVARSADVVTTANALQVLVHSGKMAEAERAARWLA